ncbi:hypothetical protein [Mucilaginibacter psychrotolerans]|uniref:hypothetical protein n=1 Tax=Mucilaginibacter psychrotolerans TaxID=1524096 RepID=UPI001864D5E8|nr:hypothetical protein [Mucilaginibacter psychrotolerans]
MDKKALSTKIETLYYKLLELKSGCFFLQYCSNISDGLFMNTRGNDETGNCVLPRIYKQAGKKWLGAGSTAKRRAAIL